MSLQREYLKRIKDWRILIDSICFADIDKLSDEQVEAYVEESIKLGAELDGKFEELAASADHQ